MNELVRFLPDRIPVLVMDDDDAVIQVIRLVFLVLDLKVIPWN
jgi:hypothetical protein